MLDASEAIIAASLALGGGLAGAAATWFKTRPSRNGQWHKAVDERLGRGDERFKELSGDIKEQGKVLASTRETVVAIKTQTEATAKTVERIEDRLGELA